MRCDGLPRFRWSEAVMGAHPHVELINRFYAAFRDRDADAMAACYHPDVVFSDPVFTHLEGARAVAMWRMLCERATDLELEWSDVRADATRGSAHWEARYTFTATGRRVHNIIDAELELADGKITKHRDTFSFWRWSRQALGAPGLLLGFTPIVRNKVRRTAMDGLEKFIAKQL
jgi:ketosteroid isomerase-like protein